MSMTRFVLAAALALAATPGLAMDLKSSDVAQGALFPVNEICARYGGGDVSPALSWSGVPSNAQSLAITMFDPDAGSEGWWHWVVVDIPGKTTSLAQGAGSGKLPDGARHLENSNGSTGYRGPCPPAGSGVHRYQITLWALSEKPALAVNAKPADAGAYLEKHAIAKARLTPVYSKEK
ncbi:MAG: YbhB/YbcL family Raf kinase inhibitor-like protein [Proteobacteria bacterium]|nr:YbhB/YbcL family Raf kinase inhibitor-like protein [Pseudomonadota bacterium]